MRWNLEWGKHASFLLDLGRDSGIVPPALRNRPEVFEDLEWIVDAFYLLLASRNAGLGLCPIPVSEITSYYQTVVRGDDPEEFIRLIQAMDDAFLTHSRALNERKHPQAGDRSDSGIVGR